MVSLDTRLQMLADMVPACPVAADIGADHGLLGAHLLQSGRCGKVQFLDISAPSLNKAKRLIDRLGLTDRAVFSVGDGARALTEPAQAVVIAGMGAESIIGIISRGRELLGDAALIVQPNLDADLLRAQLVPLGYVIADEAIAHAAGRWYVGLRCVPGQAHYTDEELLIGPVLLQKRPLELHDYAQWRVKVLSKAIIGADQHDPEHADVMRWQIDRWSLC